MNDIFNESNKIKLNTFRFMKIGDKIQGTLVAKRTTVNMLRGGEEQMVYDLKQTDGNKVSVFGKPGIDLQLKSIKLGQIIGFEYVRDLPPKVVGHKPTRIIQVYANKDVVDAEWMKEKEEEESISAMSGAESQTDPLGTDEDVPFRDAPVARVVTKEDMIKQIALTKLPDANEENWKLKVMEKTGLAFIPVNEDQILAKL